MRRWPLRRLFDLVVELSDLGGDALGLCALVTDLVRSGVRRQYECGDRDGQGYERDEWTVKIEGPGA